MQRALAALQHTQSTVVVVDRGPISAVMYCDDKFARNHMLLTEKLMQRELAAQGTFSVVLFLDAPWERLERVARERVSRDQQVAG